MSTLHFGVHTHQLVTPLQLTSVFIQDEDTYLPFCDALVALRFLNHLELQTKCFIPMQPRLRIVLPAIHFLCLDTTENPEALGIAIKPFQAASLITLSGIDGLYVYTLEKPLKL